MLKGFKQYPNLHFLRGKKVKNKAGANRLFSKKRIAHRKSVKISDELASEYPSKCAQATNQQ